MAYGNDECSSPGDALSTQSIAFLLCDNSAEDTWKDGQVFVHASLLIAVFNAGIWHVHWTGSLCRQAALPLTSKASVVTSEQSLMLSQSQLLPLGSWLHSLLVFAFAYRACFVRNLKASRLSGHQSSGDVL